MVLYTYTFGDTKLYEFAKSLFKIHSTQYLTLLKQPPKLKINKAIKMKLFHLKTLSLIAATFLSSLTFAEDSSQHLHTASKHSALASAHVTVGSAKAVATAVALPLIAVGSASTASTNAGSAILQSTQAHEPLEITDITITQDPSPAHAMQ